MIGRAQLQFANAPRKVMSMLSLVSADAALSATIDIEFIGNDGQTIPGSSGSSIQVAVTTTPQSLANLMEITAGEFTDQTIPGIPDEAADVRIAVNSASATGVRFNFGGTKDGTAGAGDGIETALSAPTASSPSGISIGQVYVLSGEL